MSSDEVGLIEAISFAVGGLVGGGILLFSTSVRLSLAGSSRLRSSSQESRNGAATPFSWKAADSRCSR